MDLFKILKQSKLIALISISTFTLFAQNKPQQGMHTKVNNFSTFAKKSISTSEAWANYNLPEDQKHPEYGFLPMDTPCYDCIEVLSRRKVDERYFVDIENPSKYYQQKAMGNLHELINNQWVSIDHHFTQSTNGIYLSGAKRDQIGINTNQFLSFMKTEKGQLSMNQWSLKIVRSESIEKLQANWDNYTIGEDGIEITNIFPGINAHMIVYRGSLKTNFVIVKNELGVFDELRFIDKFSSEKTTTLSFEDGLQTKGIGKINVNFNNEEIAKVDEALCYALNGPKDIGFIADYEIREGNNLEIIIPYRWIITNLKNYSLVIDPTVTGTNTLAQASITGSMYNASCNFTNSCNYNLSVPRPANATITDVTTSFTYTATGACWLEDGATRYAVGGCVSPAAAGFYWYCNLASGGTCTGTNTPIFADVASCIPAPGCVITNVPFVLQFFRSCWGTAGCSNACIGAGSPWSVTITGITLAPSNVVTPVTVSATTICQGQSLTASTLGATGVPGYTYNWSFSATGIPSVGTGLSASIVFPLSGSITLYSLITDACGNVVTNSRVITVNPTPVAVATPTSQTICSGLTTAIALSSITPLTTFAWTVVQAGVTGASAGAGANIAQVLTTTGAVPGTATYTITPTRGTCVGLPIIVVITVNPAPIVVVNSGSICSGSSLALLATGATTYVWTANASLSGILAGAATATPTVTTVYTVTGTSLGCSASATSTVTVNPTPVAVATPTSQTFCSGLTTGIALSSVTPLTTFAWTVVQAGVSGASAGSGANIAQVLTTTGAVPGTATYTITPTRGTCVGLPIIVVITVNPAPIVVVNSGSICSGNSLALLATGATTYVWTANASLSGILAGAATATPTVTTVYTVTGTSLGCSASANSTVTVNTTPIAIATPTSQTFCSGLTTAIALSSITPLTTFAWTVVQAGVTGASAGAGANIAQALTTTGAVPGTAIYTITPTAGTCIGVPIVVIITVNPIPIVTVNSGSICLGSNLALVAGGATTYVWTANATLSAIVAGTATATPTVTTVYTVTGTSSGCTASATSTVTVNATPIAVATPAVQSICSGFTTGIALSSVTPLTTFTWTVVQAGVSGASNSTGANIAQLLSTTGVVAGTATYTITPTVGTCVGSPIVVIITVNPSPTVLVNSATICSGNNIALLATGATAYVWTANATLSGIAAGSATATPTITTNYTVTGTSLGCTNSAVSTVTVNPTPIAIATPTNQTICSGITTGIALSSATPLTTFAWTVVQAGVTGASAGTGTNIAQVLTNTGAVAGTATYTITPTTGACVGATIVVVITINPLPTVTVNSGTICSGNSIVLTAGGATTYVWTASATLSAILAGSATATPPSTTNYTVTGTALGCTGTATSTVTINPTPTAIATPTSQTICSGITTGIALSSATPLTTFAWTVIQAGASGASNGTGTSIAQTLNTIGAVAGTATYTITPTSGTCVGAAIVVVITVNPIPLVTVNSGTICAGSNLVLTGGGAATYVWTANATLSAILAGSATATPLSTTSYTVTGTSLGCNATTTSTVTVNPLPTIVVGNNGPLCIGNTLNLTATSGAGATYSWSGPNGFTSTAQNPSIASIVAASIGIYTVTVTLNGCVSTSSTTLVLNGGVIVTINPVTALCDNVAPITLTSPNVGGTWTGTGITNGSTGSFDPSVATAGVHVITYTIPGACSGAVSINVTVLASPTAQFTSNITTGCAPLSVTFTDNSIPASASQTWNFGNGASSTGAFVNSVYNAQGCNDVTLVSTSANGCVSSQMSPAYICVVAQPDVSFAVNQNEASINDPSFQFTNTSTGATAYTWDFGDNSSSNTFSPNHLYAEIKGNYTVVLIGTNAAGCIDSATLNIKVIEDLIYYIPNSFTPNGDEHNNSFKPIFTSGFDPFSFSFMLFNRWGEVIFESNDHTVGWDGTFNGVIVQDGNYTWKVQFKDSENDKKFFKTGSVTIIK